MGNLNKIRNNQYAINFDVLNHGAYAIRCDSGFICNSTNRN